ncbi:MAG: phage tail protein [Alphaproteobacteria bacterium]|nr:phage tail protein [Alphaproteobacteria bacterium]|tara:strand:- start:471128 stop:472684 length:1557 start_codon:yes stop_codon:yes gene_type:complete
MDQQRQDMNTIKERYNAALNNKSKWETLWSDCYAYTLPQRSMNSGGFTAGKAHGKDIYDATALDATDQLASSLLANLAPPWSAWFGFKPGPDMTPEQADKMAPQLDRIAKIMQDHIDRSNFNVEIHQCFLDLVIGGTASIMIEEAPPGEFSALKFTALPLQQFAVAEGAKGTIDSTFRSFEMSYEQVKSRFPEAEFPPRLLNQGEKDPKTKVNVLESVTPYETYYMYDVLLPDDDTFIHRQRLSNSPFINFRWMKSPGEVYGRSPVMKALPDIKTANKVVELVLKNASIAVTGIWQADDDGVLNAANIELKPGAVIPKAVGSRGLTPLEMPGKFDVSELVLEDLRARIRHALLIDRLGMLGGRSMTATEVLERSAEIAEILGATYGRLQAELLTPLIRRVMEILKRRGEIPDIILDGRSIALEYRSPLARAQGQRNIQTTLSWLQTVQALGPAAAMVIDQVAAAKFLGEALGVPNHLIKRDDSLASALGFTEGSDGVAQDVDGLNVLQDISEGGAGNV